MLGLLWDEDQPNISHLTLTELTWTLWLTASLQQDERSFPFLYITLGLCSVYLKHTNISFLIKKTNKTLFIGKTRRRTSKEWDEIIGRWPSARLRDLQWSWVKVLFQTRQSLCVELDRYGEEFTITLWVSVVAVFNGGSKIWTNCGCSPV